MVWVILISKILLIFILMRSNPFFKVKYTKYGNIFVFLFCFSFLPNKIISQICTGNVGNYVYFNDFGSGVAIYGPALPAGETNYPYVTGSPPNGSYVISNTPDPSGINGYLNCGDHTGNLNGYMMVINADYPPDTVYTTKITGLCPNTTYVFSSYIANNNTSAIAVSNCGSSYIYANVKMQVEYPTGTVQGSISTGNLPTAPTPTALVWKQEGFVFTTVAGQTTVDLVLINNAPGGCGNDYVVDDISLAPCGPGMALSISPNQSFFCPGQQVTLLSNYTSGSYSNPQYQWQFSNNGGVSWTNIIGANASSYSINSLTAAQGGMYQLIAAENGNIGSPFCSILAGPLSFSVGFQMSVACSNLNIQCASNSIDTLTASGATTYSWSNGAITNSIVVSPTSTTNYTVVGTAGTCTSQAVATVTVMPSNINLTITGSTTLCLGASTTLHVSGANSYSWSNGATGSFVTVSPLNTSTISVTGYVGNCSTTTVLTLSVMANPILTVSGNTLICSGQGTKLTSSGANSYTWSTGSNAQSVFLNPFNTSTYTLTGTDGTCNTISVITVSVNPNPLTSIQGNTVVCLGNGVTLSANGANSYVWSTGQTGASITFTPTTSGTYTVLGSTGICHSQSAISIQVLNELILFISGIDTICSGESDVLTAHGSVNYVWNDGENTTSIVVFPSVTTTYSVSSDLGTCQGSAFKTVFVKPGPIAVCDINSTYISNPLVFFNNHSSNYSYWYWNFGDGSPLDSLDVNALHYYNTEIPATYQASLTLINKNGCREIVYINVIIQADFAFYIPNTFTPNGDGINEVFKGEGIGIQSYEMDIFDRWGNHVFHSDDIENGWNGTGKNNKTIVEEDIYVWKVLLRDVVGKSHYYSGVVALIK